MSNEPGNRYNIQLINALVLYVGTQAIAHIHNKGSTPSMSTITHSAHMDIFQNLAVDLDTEGEDPVPAGRLLQERARTHTRTHALWPGHLHLFQLPWTLPALLIYGRSLLPPHSWAKTGAFRVLSAPVY